jgi:hypothetical protein
VAWEIKVPRGRWVKLSGGQPILEGCLALFSPCGAFVQLRRECRDVTRHLIGHFQG